MNWLKFPQVLVYLFSLLIVAGSANAHEHGHAKDMVDGLAIENAWSRTVPVAGMNAAGYMEIKNEGDEPVTLTAFTTEAADETSLHETVKEGDTVSMQALPEGITIPPKQSVSLSPGGLHLMFLGIKKPFSEGEDIPVTLVFDSGTQISTSLKVKPLGDAEHDMKHDHKTDH